MHKRHIDRRTRPDPKPPQQSRFAALDLEELRLLADRLDPEASPLALGMTYEILRDIRARTRQEKHDDRTAPA